MNVLKFSIIIISLIYPTLTFSQQSDSISVENSLLWKISGNELTDSSYLFGTIHIIPKEEFFYTESMKSAFEASKKLIMEVDLDVSFSDQLALMQKMILPEKKSISSYMGKQEYDNLLSYLKDSLKLSGMSLMTIQKLKPMLSFSVILEEKIKKAKVYEMHFMKLAKKRKMEVVGLETLDEQVSIIDNVPIDAQVQMLLEMTKSQDILKDYYEMLQIYKNQEINKLYNYAKEDQELEKYTDELLVNRNQKWVSKLAKLMNEDVCFIAVGSGHLAGKDGLINLLRQEGYLLSPVNLGN